MNNEVTLWQMSQYIRDRLESIYPKGETDGFTRIIYHHVLNYEPVDILLHKDSVLPDFVIDKIRKVVDALLEHEPIQYIFGEADFYGRSFAVDRSTLIPRPETAELVDIIADENKDSDLRVLDAGTGSGCIAVSLALTLRFPAVTAVDISEEALSVAAKNAARYKAKVRFRSADILSMIPADNEYDIIVSNPPYIADSEKTEMDKNVLDYEPAGALFVPDSDPLRFYRALAKYGVTALKPGGKIYFEINSHFPEEMRLLLKEYGYDDVLLRRDMQGLYRFASAIKI